MKKIIVFLSCIVYLGACKKSKSDIYERVYDVEFVGLWSEATHPTDYPSNAHFSSMVGFSHLSGLNSIQEGTSATEGLKQMAETGATAVLEEEIQKFINLDYASDKFIEKGFTTPGKSMGQIGVKSGKHTVTVFSMIAPSPDWFVAAKTSLLDTKDGLWYDYVEVVATVYDAGTDSGTSFTSANAVSNPLEPVHVLKEGPLTNGTDSILPMAKFIFRHVK